MLSLPPLLIGTLAAMACALPGNFLLLRRQSMLGDAVSHVVLPGIVAAFLLTGSVASLPMLLGALAAALVSVIMIETIRHLARIEPGAAMAIVFTSMFAAGVLALELSDTSSVHLDVEHALYGNLESLIWIDAVGLHSLIDPKALAGLPPQLPRMAVVFLVIALMVWLFWRALVISSFDEPYARAIGLPARVIGFGLAAGSALAAVAAFDAVGAIIVIAMFTCPPAAARMMTNHLGTQVGYSLGFAMLSAIGGYLLAGYGPLLFGSEHAVSAAGLIATVSGIILGLTAWLGPYRRG